MPEDFFICIICGSEPWKTREWYFPPDYIPSVPVPRSHLPRHHSFPDRDAYVPENGSYKISYLDIDARINKLFGKGLTYTHTTVGDEELMFVYDEETGMYSIPTTPRTLAYFACVDELVPDGNGYILTVSYKTPLTNWISTNTSADKIMTYRVVGNGLTYNISSLEIKEISNTNGL